MAATEQYLSSLSWMACFTAPSSSWPRRRYSISNLVHTVGGSTALSPEQITSRDSSFCLFFSRMMTTSVAVQAPSPNRRSSIGPGALFDARSESRVIPCPDGLVATNFCSPTHFTIPVCIQPLPRRIFNPRLFSLQLGGGLAAGYSDEACPQHVQIWNFHARNAQVFGIIAPQIWQSQQEIRGSLSCP